MRHLLSKSWVGLLGMLLLLSCQGQPSRNAPIHLNPNMDDQQKVEAQEQSSVFADSAGMRVPPAGTIARGGLRDGQAFYRGLSSHGEYLTANPLEVTLPLLKRGRERFDIYCAPCHSRVGDGRGIMVTRGYVPPPSFHTDFLRQYPDGQLFETITNGVRNMPGYGSQIDPTDRWAIVAYVRALQRSQNADLDDVPEEKRPHLR